MSRICRYDDSGLWEVEFDERKEHRAIESLGLRFRAQTKGENRLIYVVRFYQDKRLFSKARAEHIERLVSEEITRAMEQKESERRRLSQARKMRNATKKHDR